MLWKGDKSVLAIGVSAVRAGFAGKAGLEKGRYHHTQLSFKVSRGRRQLPGCGVVFAR